MGTYLIPAQHWARSRFGLAGEAQRVAGLNIAHLGRHLGETWRRFRGEADVSGCCVLVCSS